MYKILVLFFVFSVAKRDSYADRVKRQVLEGKIICIDAGHGGTAATDSYRQGPTGEREEWINLRVAFLLKQLLEKKGAKVIMTRTEDVFVPIPDRAKIARDNHADLFLSIHHNATADTAVNFPIIYFHGHVSENRAGVLLGKQIAKSLSENFYEKKPSVSLVSDYTIFSSGGAGVLRGTYGIPAVLSEASFFTNPTEEGRLKSSLHNQKEAEAYCLALEAFFAQVPPAIVAENTLVQVSPFKGVQEAERMSETAKHWKEDYEKGLDLLKMKKNIQQAYDFFTRSARSFPDSYVARACHENRALLLRKEGKEAEAAEEERRAQEFYVDLNELDKGY